MDLKIPSCVGLYYNVKEKIGKGSFGVIYRGISIKDKKEVAIKFEDRYSHSLQLRGEYQVYMLLKGSENIPIVYYFGQEGVFNVLVMDLLGENIETLFSNSEHVFELSTVCLLAIEMISLIEKVHRKGFVYRDIKPENFVFDLKGENLFIIDFGMTRLFYNQKTKEHIQYNENRTLTGTARYMSINTHVGIEQSRRDDIEALGYLFLYLFKGRLPWQGLCAKNGKEKFMLICQVKSNLSVEEICNDLPLEIQKYISYSRQLEFDEEPDYDYLKSLFNSILKRIQSPFPSIKWSLFSKKIDKTFVTSEKSSKKKSWWCNINNCV